MIIYADIESQNDYRFRYGLTKLLSAQIMTHKIIICSDNNSQNH